MPAAADLQYSSELHRLNDKAIVLTGEAAQSAVREVVHLGGQILNYVAALALHLTFVPGYHAAVRSRVSQVRCEHRVGGGASSGCGATVGRVLGIGKHAVVRFPLLTRVCYLRRWPQTPTLPVTDIASLKPSKSIRRRSSASSSHTSSPSGRAGTSWGQHLHDLVVALPGATTSDASGPRIAPLLLPSSSSSTTTSAPALLSGAASRPPSTQSSDPGSDDDGASSAVASLVKGVLIRVGWWGHSSSHVASYERDAMQILHRGTYQDVHMLTNAYRYGCKRPRDATVWKRHTPPCS